ncbi:MAG TPA: YfiR family protein [Fluviicoccus sp.]|nr:YfiR family protein [Fluviicoccus sp.]
MEHRRPTVIKPYLLGICLAFGVSASTLAGPDESEIKAAFIYNFAKFVEWPADAFEAADSAIDLCLSGHDSVEAELRQLEGREAQGRKLHVRSLSGGEDRAGCEILYLAGPDTPQQSALLQALGNDAVLTVADRRDFARQGGIISLFVEGSRVQFAVNLGPAQSRGLKFSARLLQLARVPR